MADYDVIIVGGGPGGSTCASYLGKKGYKALLLDKAKFPRDKTCGDGISGKSTRILDELGVAVQVEKSPHAEMNGVIFSSPKGEILEVEVPEGGRNPAGYVCRREVFDNVLFQNAKNHATVMEEFTVTDVLKEGTQVVGVEGMGKDGKKQQFKARIVVGADGALSTVSRKLGFYDDDPEHVLVGMRCYYEGVTGMKDKIELHFTEELIPGYFWIFPIEGGKANIGLGMVVKDFQTRYKGKRLDDIMFKIIQEHPLFKDRFKDAKQVTPIRGWNLPCGSKLRKMVADGALLIGDAAALIDPLSGEGIGNAMTSGKMASEVIDNAFKANDFTAKALMPYQDMVYSKLGSEMKLSYKLQKMGVHKWLLNFIIGKAVHKPELRDVISMSLMKPEEKEVLTSPLFYLKLLFF